MYKSEGDKKYKEYEEAYNEFLKISVLKKLDGCYTLFPHPFSALIGIIMKIVRIVAIAVGIVYILSCIVNFLYMMDVINKNLIVMSINVTAIIQRLGNEWGIPKAFGALIVIALTYVIKGWFYWDRRYKPVKRSEYNKIKNKFIEQKNKMQQYKTENGICEDMYIIMDEESKTFKAKLTDECAKLHFKRKYAGMSPEKIKELQRMEAESNVSFFSTIRNTLFEITDSANVGCRYCSWSTLHSKNMRIISKCCNCGATGTKIRKSSGSYYWYECSECGSTDFQSLCPKCGMPL